MQNAPLEARMNTAYYEYDFEKHGGAIGTITLSLASVIPQGAIVPSGMIKVLTAFTSAGAPTVQLKCVGTDDVLAATLKGALTLNAVVDVVPDGTASNAISTADTARAGLTMTIAVATITAGKMIIMLNWLQPGQA